MTSVYSKSYRVLEERRLFGIGLQEARLNEVYEKIPEILEGRNQMKLTGLEVSRAVLRGGDERELIEKLRETSLDLQKRETFLLEQNGFSKDYLTNVFKCNKCDDKGYIDGNVMCSCLKQVIIENAYEMSNINKDIAEENFDTFDFRYFEDREEVDGITPKDKMMQNYRIAQRFIKEFDTRFLNLYMYGDVGLGKSFLCNCIAKELLDTSHTVISISATDLFKVLEEHKFHRDDSNHDELINYIKSADLLIIDDLGTEVNTSVTSSELFNIINRRQTDRKHTIISTNLAPIDLESIYSHRLESRFIGNFELMKFIGNDIRLSKKFNLA